MKKGYLQLLQEGLHSCHMQATQLLYWKSHSGAAGIKKVVQPLIKGIQLLDGRKLLIKDRAAATRGRLDGPQMLLTRVVASTGVQQLFKDSRCHRKTTVACGSATAALGLLMRSKYKVYCICTTV